MFDLLLGYGYYFVYSVHQNFSVKSFFYKEILHKLTHKILRSLAANSGLGAKHRTQTSLMSFLLRPTFRSLPCLSYCQSC